MTPAQISPRAPVRRHLPGVALLGLLLILSISHVYLQQAYPLHSLAVGAGIALLATALLLWPAAPAGARVPRWPAPLRRVMVLQAAWLLWWAVVASMAPVASIGRPFFLTIFWGFLVFYIACESAWRWTWQPAPGEGILESASLREADKGGAAHILSAGEVGALWLALAGVALAAYGMYQVWGPAGWPKTFASIHEALRSAMDEPGMADAAVEGTTLQGVMHALEEGRAFSTFGAPNLFAGFLIPSLAVLAAWVVSPRSRMSRGMAASGMAVVVAAMILSQSRGGCLAAAGALAWLGFRLWRAGIFKRRGTRGGRETPGNQGGDGDARGRAEKFRGAGAVVILLAAAAWYSLRAIAPAQAEPVSAAEKPPSALRNSAIASTDSAILRPGSTAENRTFFEHLLSSSTIRERTYYWRTAFDLWKRHPWIGAGAGGFEVYYPELRRPGAGETVFAHNWVLQTAGEAGLIGLALFCVAVVVALVLGANAIRRPHGATTGATPASVALFGLEAGCAGLLLQGLVEYTLSQRELYLDLMMMLGLLSGSGGAALAKSFLLQAPASPATPTSAPAAPLRKWRAGWPLIPAALLWIVFVLVAVPGAFSRFYMQAARDAMRDGAPPAELIGFYKRALSYDPSDPWTLAAIGQAEVESGNSRGIDFLRRAARIHPKSASIQGSLARALERTGALEAALAASRRAVELHPLSADHRLDLAERLMRIGRMEEARGVLREILQMKEKGVMRLSSSRQARLKILMLTAKMEPAA